MPTVTNSTVKRADTYTVRELIAELEKYPQDAPVEGCVEDYGYGDFSLAIADRHDDEDKVNLTFIVLP